MGRETVRKCAKGRKRERRTVSRRDSARQGFAAVPDGVQSPARNKYNRNPRLTSRIDNDLLPIERDTVDRSSSILLDRVNPARRTRSPTCDRADVRTRTRNPARGSDGTVSISRDPRGVRAASGGVDSLPSSRSPTLARELPVGHLEDRPMSTRSETGGIDSDDDGDDDDEETVLQGTHR